MLENLLALNYYFHWPTGGVEKSRWKKSCQAAGKKLMLEETCLKSSLKPLEVLRVNNHFIIENINFQENDNF